MHRNERPTRGYVRYFPIVDAGSTSKPQRIDWKVCGEVVGISCTLSNADANASVGLMTLVDLQIKVDAGKDSLGTDGQGDVPIPFAHIYGLYAGPAMGPWLRWVNQQEAFDISIRNRYTEAVDAVVTVWVREGIRRPKEE